MMLTHSLFSNLKLLYALDLIRVLFANNSRFLRCVALYVTHMYVIGDMKEWHPFLIKSFFIIIVYGYVTNFTISSSQSNRSSAFNCKIKMTLRILSLKTITRPTLLTPQHQVILREK